MGCPRPYDCPVQRECFLLELCVVRAGPMSDFSGRFFVITALFSAVCPTQLAFKNIWTHWLIFVDAAFRQGGAESGAGKCCIGQNGGESVAEWEGQFRLGRWAGSAEEASTNLPLFHI